MAAGGLRMDLVNGGPTRVERGCMGLAISKELGSCHGKGRRHDFGYWR